MTAAVRLGVLGDVANLTLRAGPLEVVVVPERAMTVASITYEGRHYVGPDDVAELPDPARGVGSGVPLLHPWANRLSEERFVVREGGSTIDLTDAPRMARDAHGAPLHGTCLGLDGWDLTWVELDAEGDGAIVEGVLAFEERDELMGPFPFPHRVHVRWEVLDAGHPDGADHAMVRCTTAVVPLGDALVPVAFGWHPHFRLPGSGRAQWRLVLPEREHLVLDERGFETGEELYEPEEAMPVGLRTFDDSYRLGTNRNVGLTCEDRWLVLALDEGYPYLQVYVPPGGDTVALEPMTAPVDSLVQGTHRWAAGIPVSATFTITCG